MFRHERLRHKSNLLLAAALGLGIGLACSPEPGESGGRAAPRAEQRRAFDRLAATDEPQKLDSYTIKGFKFSYYLIPAGLSRDELIATAQRLHDDEPDAQLILVDDASGLADYVAYAKQMSKGETAAQFPKDWAENHIVANVQKYLSGQFKLCKSYGSVEIAELE